ncbi:MAG TPA: hypothetical protein VNQ99_00935 [Xanthobacteraceae bacterium]|nr:hypothetical protein [Xanthobacteraceae bacterium]
MWSTPVDLYCERTDVSFWSEPLNALTNVAFLIAAYAAFRIWRAQPARDTPALLLIGVVVLVGFGSFAFHTLATRGASLFDVIPIAVFIYGYLALALRRFFRLPLLWVAIVLVGFAGASMVTGRVLPAGFLNGSGGYLPALAAMVVVGLLLRALDTGRRVLVAALVFSASIALRAMDHDLCEAFPVGTHIGWHCLNAVVLFLLLRAAILHPPMRASEP